MNHNQYFLTRFAPHPDRHRLWPILVKYLERNQYIPPDGVVLDLGAGYCDFINHVCAREKHALDIAATFRQYAASAVDARVGSCTDLGAYEANYFDAVFASNLFEHLERSDFWETLRQIATVLRPGGRLVVIQPNFRRCVKEYFDDYTHAQIFTDKSLPDALGGAGFEVLRVVRGFLPFSLKSRLPKAGWLLRLYLASPYKPRAGQMLVVAQKPHAALNAGSFPATAHECTKVTPSAS